MRGLSIRFFWNGIGEANADPEWPNGFKNSTNVYSIHLELRMALPCQISTGKWKYVNPCLDFLGIPDQRTAYVKRQARPRWTYVRRSSVTPDLIISYSIYVLRWQVIDGIGQWNYSIAHECTHRLVLFCFVVVLLSFRLISALCICPPMLFWVAAPVIGQRSNSE